MKSKQSFLLTPFRQIICAATLWLLSPFAGAGEVKGVDIPEKVAACDCTLVLNGTATRTVWGFGVYVVGLYLTEPNQSGKSIMRHDRDEKRLHITMLRGVTGKRFASTIEKNIDSNFSAKEKKRFSSEFDAFLDCFGSGSALRKSSVVNIDFLPGRGTQVSLDGNDFEMIPGDDFYHALLRLWIGKPLQTSVKHGLLGNKS